MKINHLITAIILGGLIATPIYAKPDHHKNQLPPGLKMKADRGGSLPPGWKKKLAKGKVLDKSVYETGTVISPPDKTGIITLRVDDKVVRLYKASREIVDILQ